MDNRSHGPVKSLAAYNAYKECAGENFKGMGCAIKIKIFSRKQNIFWNLRTLILNICYAILYPAG